jgi:hypothetical protein
MADASPPLWVSIGLPIVTLVAGYALNMAGDFLKDERTTRRELTKQEAERAFASKDRRESFQRDTLSKLQDALIDLNIASINLGYEKWLVARGRVSALRAQVEDARLRELTFEFEAVAQDIIEARADERDGFNERRQEAFASATERLGTLLLSLYHAD